MCVCSDVIVRSHALAWLGCHVQMCRFSNSFWSFSLIGGQAVHEGKGLITFECSSSSLDSTARSQWSYISLGQYSRNQFWKHWLSCWPALTLNSAVVFRTLLGYPLSVPDLFPDLWSGSYWRSSDSWPQFPVTIMLQGGLSVTHSRAELLNSELWTPIASSFVPSPTLH